MSTAQPITESIEKDQETQFEEPTATFGLSENAAGALSYALGPITGILMYLLESKNEFVRFHAAQSTALFGVLFVANLALGMVGTTVASLAFTGGTGSFMVFSLVSLVISLAGLALAVGALVLWVYLMVRAYQGRTPRIPIAAKLADRVA